MDDGTSWIGIVLFAASVILFAVMYGFGAAVQALNTSALEDERDEGNKRAEKLLKIQEDPYLFIRTNQLATSILTLAMGASSLLFVVRNLDGAARSAHEAAASGCSWNFICRGTCGNRIPAHGTGDRDPEAHRCEKSDPVLL